MGHTADLDTVIAELKARIEARLEHIEPREGREDSSQS